MNCENARELLPLEIYGDLAADDRTELLRHLEGCDACRCERETLRDVRQSLDAASVPKAAVDVGRIHQDAVATQHRSLRRWKRSAFVIGSLAAGLLLVLLIRPDIRIGNGQFVISWSEPRTE